MFIEMDIAEHESSASLLSDLSTTSNVSTITHKRKAGRQKFRETRDPIYRGVRQRKGAKCVCEVCIPNNKSRIWLGTHVSPEMAARAYDVVALALKGKSTPLNFPDSAWLLPRAKSSLPSDIRAVSLKAAEAFRSTTMSTSSLTTCLKSPSMKSLKKVLDTSSIMFLDEEARFNMPALLASMAEGLLLAPLAMHKGFNYDDDVDCTMDLSLWSD